MASPKKIKIEESWKQLLADEFQAPYFNEIKSFLQAEKSIGKIIYPPGSQIFNAFNSTPVQNVKVVIIGQDPYHGPGQAMGLCFSVGIQVAIPASLRNIYKEIKQDLDLPIPSHGDLTKWTHQGVFLLNAILTVEERKAGSHRKIGWEKFTDAVIQRLSNEKDGIVFMLWGNFAKSKKALIDETKHHVLEAVHPSPLAGGAFMGCRHFSKANDYLVSTGRDPIDWSVD